jgi:hypothetical protein
MDGHVPHIRLKRGVLFVDNTARIDFLLGLVYDVNGEFVIELHFDESAELLRFYDAHKESFLSKYATIMAKTEKGDDFEASQVLHKSLQLHNFMGDFICTGSIKIKQSKSQWSDEDEDLEQRESLHFVIVEGLAMKHNFHSKDINDNSLKNDKFYFEKDGIFDISEVAFQLEDYTSHFFYVYKKNSDQHVLEFRKYAQYEDMTLTIWNRVKNDFMSFLSLLNGARVFVREEHYGRFWNPKNLKSETSIYYSFEKSTPKSYNRFFAINQDWYRSEGIVANAFMKSFRNYLVANVKWDLNTIIFYLNNSEESLGLGDKIFIQTIMLERLGKTYANLSGEQWQELIPPDLFFEVKDELLDVLVKHEEKFDSRSFGIFRNKISNLNKTKRTSFEVKFNNLIRGVGIQITENVQSLISKRNPIIHEGEIGQFKEALEDYQLMDKLIRKIITKIIDYDGPTILDGKEYYNPPPSPFQDI